MKTTCLINNFNYKDYVCEAINSALGQTHPFDEIIVVDDASTDGSDLILQEQYRQNPHVKIIIHPHNQGQLAAVTTGFLESTGGIIFFLDADDFYHPQYLEIALKIYQSHPVCGFLYCQMGTFSNSHNNYQSPIQSQLEQYKDYIQDHGYSVILTLEELRFVGSPSSGNSIRREYLKEILPCNCIGDYRLWADNCVVFGSSILGARKFFLNLPLIGYRRHENNDSNNSYLQSRFKFYQNQTALVRLFTYLSQKIHLNNSLISKNAPYEFKTVDYPTWDLFFAYLKIMLRHPSGVPFSPLWIPSKLYGLVIMLKHILKFKKSSKH